MSLTAQLTILGYDRPTLDAEFRSRLERHPVGGVFLYGDALGAPAQVRALTDELQSCAGAAPRNRGFGLPLLIAIDQEGGRPLQAWGPPHQEVIPPAAQLGADYEAFGERLEVTLLAMEIGRALQAAGINLGFAPVLDVHTCPDNPIIGERSFGSRPELVAEVGSAFLEGLQAAGVLACGKHFPGHGDTDLDSHLTLPAVGHDLARLRDVELLPFAAAMSRGLEVIMTAHVLYPAWDAEHPATLHGRSFRGCCATSSASAASSSPTTSRCAVCAITTTWWSRRCWPARRAATLLLSTTEHDRQEELLESLARAHRDGRLSTERLEESLRRIAALKQDWLVPA